MVADPGAGGGPGGPRVPGCKKFGKEERGGGGRKEAEEEKIKTRSHFFMCQIDREFKPLNDSGW